MLHKLVLLKASIFLFAGCHHIASPININDFTILNRYTNESISLMDRRDEYPFLASIEHKEVYSGVIIEYSNSIDNVEMVYSMIITEPGFVTSRMIGIGSSRSDVEKKYGKLQADSYKEEPQDIAYSINVDAKKWNQLFVTSFYLLFKLEENNVNKIVVSSYYPF